MRGSRGSSADRPPLRTEALTQACTKSAKIRKTNSLAIDTKIIRRNDTKDSVRREGRTRSGGYQHTALPFLDNIKCCRVLPLEPGLLGNRGQVRSGQTLGL